MLLGEMGAAYLGSEERVSRLAYAALAGLLFMLAPLAPSAARAGGVYRYVDSRGVVHFTNVQWDKRYSRVALLPRVQIVRDSPAERGKRARSYDPLVQRVGLAQGVPPALVKAVIRAESAFDPRAVSHKGAMGLMQLMPATARSLGVAEPFTAEQNVAGGTRYLRELRERFGSWTMALAAYNAGPDAVTKFGGIPPYRETQTYVRRVFTYYRQYHPQFAVR